jgi:hypothetical protein
MTGPTDSRTHGMAVTAMVVAALSYLCMWGIGGFAAIVLGVAARHAVLEAGGRYRGTRLATVAIALGGLNLLATAAGAVLLVQWMDESRAGTTSAHAASPRPTPVPHAPAPLPPSGPPTPEPHRFSTSGGVWVTELGRIVLVDVPSDAPSLGAELDTQGRLAEASSRRLLVWIVAPSCEPCDGVAAALDAPELQRALADTRLVRVNVRAFAAELQSLGFPIEKIPGFVIPGPAHRVVDYIHGGEWEADIAPNIGPVLEDFVNGRLAVRRNPWRGGHHPDETNL